MHKSILLIFGLWYNTFCLAQNDTTHAAHNYSYLALGDSYTIGASVALYESYPYQTVQELRKLSKRFTQAEIVAKSGWTTGELSDAIDHTKLLPVYDFVSLLIGVNNEYRGKEEKEYEAQFEQLLREAIHLAGDNPAHVFVLSIPDWSLTPFAQATLPDAKGRDQARVAEEMKVFNAAGKRISMQYKANYIDISTDTRRNINDPSFLASDLLHPSGKEYANWAKLLAEGISKQAR